MFTGLIEEVGSIRSVSAKGPLFRLEVRSDKVAKSVKKGDSVAVNGACLTSVGGGAGLLAFDVMAETARRTGLSELKAGNMVNLEDSLKAGESLGGHFVLGHVDCRGKIKRSVRSGEDRSFYIEIPGKFTDFIVEKGSVSVDGVSLTVGDVRGPLFSVYLIPHTMKSTTFGLRREGDMVNIEFDILGKYILKAASAKEGKITDDFLRNNGFLA